MNTSHNILIQLFAVAMVPLLSNCNNSANLEALQKLAPESALKQKNSADVAVNKVTVKANFCTQSATKDVINLKYIFVLDKSGSNQTLAGSLGSDPDGTRRYNPITAFLGMQTGDPSISFALINFSTDTKVIADFTNDNAGFAKTVTQQASLQGSGQDGGWTNYLTVLNTINKMIGDDIVKAKAATTIVSSYYVVFFISDGSPWISDKELQAEADVLAAEKVILANAIGNQAYVNSIQINTGYYYTGQPDPAAKTYMADMAKTGNGDSYVFGAGQVIDFSKYQIPSRNLKHLLKDVIAVNENTLWQNGELVLDSDGDGISDADEAKLGSNPNKADSDNNSISDGVENYVFGKPCADPTCTVAKANQFAACQGYIDTAATATNGFTSYQFLTKDFLNNCEKLLLGANISDWDSNGDWIPDDIELRFHVGFIAGDNDAGSDSAGDGISNYEKIKMNEPIGVNINNLPNLLPYSYTLTPAAPVADTDCYSLEVDNITVLSDADKIRLYVLEGTSVVTSRHYLRTAEGSAPKGTSVINFTDTDFK